MSALNDHWQTRRVKRAIAGRARIGWRKLRARVSNDSKPVILMYHRIAREDFDPWGIAVAPQIFANQLAWLGQHRTVIPLSEFATLHREGALADDAVAVTFDDGYACTGQVAVPLLERFGVPATVFLSPGLIGRRPLFWWDELQQIVMSHSRTSFQAFGEDFHIGERQDRDGVWPRDNRKRTPRQAAFYALWARLQPLADHQIQELMGELRAQQASGDPDETHRLMTLDEIRSIRSGGIDFGSHAMTHVSLPILTSDQKAREIQDSVAACEKLVGTPPACFAYPFGDFNPECEALVAAAGFTCACTVEPRPVDKDDDPFALPRLKVENWTPRQLRQKLAEACLESEALALRT